jgi:hypothetical protein
MKERFSKNRMLLVLETLIRQSVWEYGQRGFGELTPRTTHADAEKVNDPIAIRIHAVYNERRAQKIFIEKWKIQSGDFLKPELVGTQED